MDEGVLQAMKNRYKRKLLQKVICDQDLDPTQNIKEIVKLMRGKRDMLIQYSRHTVSWKFIPYGQVFPSQNRRTFPPNPRFESF